MDDHYLVHIDRVDPQKDPLGHLIKDAPQVIVAGIIIAGAYFIFKTLLKDDEQTKDNTKKLG